MSHESLADREYARNVGHDNPERAYILSDRDVWYRNPAYTGPELPHPEDDSAADFIAEHGIEAWRARPRRSPVPGAGWTAWGDGRDPCPF
ncbi:MULTISPECIES: hypothetical protein [Acetobacteraceae]|nr:MULTISPECIES: hypothetical protein [Acetobacteraceae]NHN86063.1 hypothetical protein [Acetobacter musti]NHN93717.1 hypothetical protein [Acetobacter sicerae]